MNFISPDLDIHPLKITKDNTQYLHFKFKGKFTEETSQAASKAWTQHMSEHSSAQFEFVWDCTEMSGFELKARKEWYKAMQNNKERIEKVYVVSDKLMIRSAAKVMLQFFGIHSEINRSSDELPSTMRL